MALLKQSTTYTRNFLMVDSTDHITGKTGLTVTVTLSKAGGAFAAAGGTITEISSGWYKIALTTTDTNTLGDLSFHCTATGADATDFGDQVVAFDTQDSVRLGLTALPNAAAEAAGGLYTRGTGAGQINQPANGQIDANAVKLGGTVQTGRDIGASVLLSAGTGTGQLDFTSGVVKANLVQILGTALTETAGQIAAAFKKWFDVATPSGTVNSIPNATAGASGGLFIAGANAATTVNITGNLTGNVSGSVGSVTGAVGSVTGAVGSVTGAVGSVSAGGIDATAITSAAQNAIADAVLDRNMATGTDSGSDSTVTRTVRQALRVLRNKVSISAGTMTVTKENDTTASFTAAVTTSAGNPISAVDPT